MANYQIKKGILYDVQPLRTKEEINRMIEALGMSKYGLRDQMLFKIGISTGIRCSDLVSLRVDQIKGKTSIEIFEGKTKKKRTVYLNSVQTDLAEYIESLSTNDIYLFSSQRGGSYNDYSSIQDIGESWETDWE